MAANDGVSRRIPTIFAIGLMVITSLAVVAARADAGVSPSGELVVTRPSSPVADRPTPAAERARGMAFQGLVPGKAACAPGFEVEGHPGLCTHGPDAAGDGIDVTEPVSTLELVAATDDGTASSTSDSASIPCYGDGTSGRRVQVVYARAADVPDRFHDIASSLVGWVARVDRTFNNSAAKTGGTRHVRWVTTPDCELTIQRVRLSSSGDDSYSNTVSELKSVGLDRTDRKYLVWVDANVYCGIASLIRDDSPGEANRNNGGPGYARIDSGCWGKSRSVEAHELMHLFGGVQYTAPNSSGGGHCTDRYDRMCYQDSQNVTVTYPCSSTSSDLLFDCNNDDYFSTDPPPGSYLATHWNTANSLFLEAGEPDAWSASKTSTTTSSPSPEPEPSPEPTSEPESSTTTTTFSGRLNGKTTSQTYSLSVGSGTLDASLSFTKASSLTLTLLDPSGSVAASNSDGSPVTLTASVSAGTYSLVVSGASGAQFTLTVVHPEGEATDSSGPTKAKGRPK